jgi:hypothetical protein
MLRLVNRTSVFLLLTSENFDRGSRAHTPPFPLYGLAVIHVFAVSVRHGYVLGRCRNQITILIEQFLREPAKTGQKALALTLPWTIPAEGAFSYSDPGTSRISVVSNRWLPPGGGPPPQSLSDGLCAPVPVRTAGWHDNMAGIVGAVRCCWPPPRTPTSGSGSHPFSAVQTASFPLRQSPEGWYRHRRPTVRHVQVVLHPRPLPGSRPPG